MVNNNKNDLGQPASSRDEILNEFRKAYKSAKSDTGSDFYNLKMAKDALSSVGESKWFNDKNTKETVKLTASDKTKYLKNMKTLQNGIESIIELFNEGVIKRQLNDEQLSKAQEKIEGLEKLLLDDSTRKKLNDLIETAQSSKSDKDINVAVRKALEIFLDAKYIIESQYGFMAENFTKNLIESKLGTFMNSNK